MLPLNVNLITSFIKVIVKYTEWLFIENHHQKRLSMNQVQNEHHKLTKVTARELWSKCLSLNMQIGTICHDAYFKTVAVQNCWADKAARYTHTHNMTSGRSINLRTACSNLVCKLKRGACDFKTETVTDYLCPPLYRAAESAHTHLGFGINAWALTGAVKCRTSKVAALCIIGNWQH